MTALQAEKIVKEVAASRKERPSSWTLPTTSLLGDAQAASRLSATNALSHFYLSKNMIGRLGEGSKHVRIRFRMKVSRCRRRTTGHRSMDAEFRWPCS